MANAAQPDLVTINEFAQLWRVSRRTVQNWIKRGRIETVKTPSGAPRIVVGDDWQKEYTR